MLFHGQTLHFPAADWTFTADSLPAPLYNRIRQAIIDVVEPTNVTDLSDESFWNATGEYADHNNTAIADYLGVSYGIMIDYNQWTTFGEPWFADYAQQNGPKGDGHMDGSTSLGRCTTRQWRGSKNTRPGSTEKS
jgi:hypothetical protein